MKQIRFTYLNKKFTLDLEKGELFGDDKKIKQQIIEGIKSCEKYNCLGGHISPYQMVFTDNLFHDKNQFAMAFFYGITKDDLYFPKELDEYLPKHKPIKQYDYSNLPKEKADAYRMIHANTRY